MDILTNQIKYKYNICKHKYTIEMDADVSSYGGCHKQHLIFMLSDWDNINKNSYYFDNQIISINLMNKIENFTTEEYYMWKYKRLDIFSDEEIVEEFNKRLNSSFHRISINNKAIVI
jgi:hypothetical protein